MRLPSVLAASAALALSFTVAAPAGAAQIWDAASDFSSTSSTLVNGVWSYGWDAGSGFQAYDQNSACVSGTPGVSCWQSPGPNLAYLVPLVAGNTSGGQLEYLSIVHPDDVLNIHPGAIQPDMLTDINSIVRFTAPTAGSYNYSGFFQVLDINPHGVNAYANGGAVLIGGAASFLDNTAGPKTTFGGTVYLTAGQNIDFRVNRGADIWNDSTGLSATITAVPEPAAWALMIAGFGGVGATLRAKRRRIAAATAA